MPKNPKKKSYQLVWKTKVEV